MADPEIGECVVQIGEEEPVSEAVLRAVVAASDRPPLGLPPLQGSVDVDALDRLFESSQSISQLRFEYSEYEVAVESESVRVSERF
jgi:hypothetical protein